MLAHPFRSSNSQAWSLTKAGWSKKATKALALAINIVQCWKNGQ